MSGGAIAVFLGTLRFPRAAALFSPVNPHRHEDTIAAIATPPGEGGIAIIRVSGPQSLSVANRIFRCKGAPPGDRPGGTFVFGCVVDGEEHIDDALCLIMRGPRSFTGEDTVELHGHGGAIAARRILRAAIQAGARLAEPGEFSRRAFLNGKIDLVQAEAILDLIRARTDRAAGAAVEQLEGILSKQINSLYDQALAVASDLEASLDFPEDELPEVVMNGIRDRIDAICRDTRALLATWEEGHLLREGATIVIAGRPNAGKSTLMNALLGKDRAIVSPIPGTTRDVIEEAFVLDGIPVRLVDTAGLHNAQCEIEREGIRRSRKQLERADLFLYVVDASLPLHEEDESMLHVLDAERLVTVANKIDLGRTANASIPESLRLVETCVVAGTGLSELKSAITERLTSRMGDTPHHAAVSERHRALLAAFLERLEDARRLVSSSGDEALVPAAAQMKDALLSLGRITGRMYEDELLDAIFSRFCIGK